jgi:two-component system LytT family sensor kinase
MLQKLRARVDDVDIRKTRPLDVLKEMIRRRSSLQWLVPSAICALLGVVFSTQDYFLQARKGEPVTWGDAFIDQLPFWFYWAILSPFIWWLARRRPVERRRWLRSLPVHFLAGLLLASVYPLLYILLYITRSGGTTTLYVSGRIHLFYFINTLVFGMIIYWVIMTIILTLNYYRKYQEEKLGASSLKAQLAQAELQSLKMQLHPHFLFNALHSVTALILKNDNREAIRMINRLSELLRLAIRDTTTQLVPLEQELEFAERYLEIERIRFQDRLTVHMDIDPRALNAEVPNLILQPLVENAVRHAIALHSTAGWIGITAKCLDQKLHLEVSDDGPGLPADWHDAKKEGVGLKNTRARLLQLYGDAYDFELSNGKEKGTVATLVLPFRVMTEAQLRELEAN